MKLHDQRAVSLNAVTSIKISGLVLSWRRRMRWSGKHIENLTNPVAPQNVRFHLMTLPRNRLKSISNLGETTPQNGRSRDATIKMQTGTMHTGPIISNA